MPKLFSRFGKLSRTANINHEGIGLGLTIVKSIIEQHDGFVNANSDGEGKGSTISFEIKIGLAPVTVPAIKSRPLSQIAAPEEVRIEVPAI